MTLLLGLRGGVELFEIDVTTSLLEDEKLYFYIRLDLRKFSINNLEIILINNN